MHEFMHCSYNSNIANFIFILDYIAPEGEEEVTKDLKTRSLITIPVLTLNNYILFFSFHLSILLKIWLYILDNLMYH